jgi:hypothetical protein
VGTFCCTAHLLFSRTLSRHAFLQSRCYRCGCQCPLPLFCECLRSGDELRNNEAGCSA